MKCMILAAGYATRLYPLTEKFPKPLLKVGDKTILDWLLEDIDSAKAVDEYIVITNHKFAGQFRAWASAQPLPIRVLDDGTESNVLVIAGDNLLDFSLTSFLDYAKQKNTSCTMRYWEADENRLRKSGVSVIDKNEVLLALEEKPDVPKSHWCTPPFYYYKAADVRRIKDAVADGCGTDAPGSLVAWMCAHSVLHSMEMPGKRYDIGSPESYAAVQKAYKGIIR